MMKKSKILTTILICILLCGCGNQATEPTTNTTSSDSLTKDLESDNPFNVEEIEASGQQVDANYGWWVSNYDSTIREIAYDGSELNLTITVDNADAQCEVGMLVFIDGIAQKYYLTEEAEASYVIPIQLEEQTQTEFSLHLKPTFGITGTEHEMYLACMYEPSYRTSESNTGYGYYSNILPGLPWNITYEVSEPEVETASCVTYNPISEDIKNQYIKTRNDGTIENTMNTSVISKFTQNDMPLENAIINAEDPIHLQLFGGTVKNYRICVFVDNKLVNAFSGKPYQDVNLDENTMADIEITLDAKTMEINDYSSMYVMLCPIDYEQFDDTFMIEKTDSLILLK